MSNIQNIADTLRKNEFLKCETAANNAIGRASDCNKIIFNDMKGSALPLMSHTSIVNDACCYEWKAKANFNVIGKSDPKLQKVLDAFAYEGYPINKDEPPIYRCMSREQLLNMKNFRSTTGQMNGIWTLSKGIEYDLVCAGAA